jgi:hypothetical protein
LAGVEQLLSLAKVVPLLFVEFVDLDMLSRLVDYALLALGVTFLDLAVDGFPMFGCAVLAEAPFLELTLELSLALDELGAYLSVHASPFWPLTF